MWLNVFLRRTCQLCNNYIYPTFTVFLFYFIVSVPLVYKIDMQDKSLDYDCRWGTTVWQTLHDCLHVSTRIRLGAISFFFGQRPVSHRAAMFRKMFIRGLLTLSTKMTCSLLSLFRNCFASTQVKFHCRHRADVSMFKTPKSRVLERSLMFSTLLCL